MPWISKRQAQIDHDYLLRIVTENSKLRDANVMLEVGVLKALAALPRLTAEAMLALPAKVLAPVVDQPLSINAADKRRVKEAREKEKEQR